MTSLTTCVLLVVIGTAYAQHGDPADGSCMCVNNNGVNVRRTACGEVFATANNGNCFVYRNNMVKCSLSGVSYDFYEVQHYAEAGWIAGTYLTVNPPGHSACSGSSGPWTWQPGTCSAIDIVTRAEWGARDPVCNYGRQSNPVNYLFIHHTAGAHCTTQAECSQQVRQVQDLHMDSNGWCDIGYTFLVGEDGRGYEGTTPEWIGAHTGGHNSVGHAISTIGTFTSVRPNDAAMMAVQHLIDCCLNQGFVVSNFKLNGHRDAGSTACPGDRYYPEIQTWPYYCFDDVSAANPGQPCSQRPLALT